jgi:hypothetical protein
MQDFHTSEDIENEIKTVSSSDNFQDQEKDFSHQKSVKKVRGELVASEGMERIEKAAGLSVARCERIKFGVLSVLFLLTSLKIASAENALNYEKSLKKHRKKSLKMGVKTG